MRLHGWGQLIGRAERGPYAPVRLGLVHLLAVYHETSGRVELPRAVCTLEVLGFLMLQQDWRGKARQRKSWYGRTGRSQQTLLILELPLAVPAPWLEHLWGDAGSCVSYGTLERAVSPAFRPRTKAVFFDFFLPILAERSWCRGRALAEWERVVCD